MAARPASFAAPAPVMALSGLTWSMAMPDRRCSYPKGRRWTQSREARWSVIRAFGLPDKFPEDALEEARQAAAGFDESKLQGREDFTDQITVTIDPVDARDFDDAVSLTIDHKTKHWQLAVHIADVAHF